MTIGEKVAYLKGLAEGMAVDSETKEGKLFAGILDVLSDIAADLEDLEANNLDLWEEVDALSAFAGEFYQAGDCRAPRNIIEATGEAWSMANLVGRF